MSETIDDAVRTDAQTAEEHLDEPECASASETLELPEEERRAGDEAEEAQGDAAVPAEERDAILQEPIEDGPQEHARPTSGATFAAAGGGWGGAEAPARRVIMYGKKLGLTVTSTKRSWGSPGSDHHVGQKRSFAVDLSNGTQPTPQMDRLAAIVATLIGCPGWKGGVLTRQMGRCRFQLLYRTDVGGNHYNHVHFGCRIV